MKFGFPKGLLYYTYNPFIETFFTELGNEIIVSPDTNKNILNEGVKYCVDEACLPIKIFHGHVDYLKDKCDILLIPRMMQVRKREYICPKFCGLPEMVINSMDDLPKLITKPIYASSRRELFNWCGSVGRRFTKNDFKIRRAFNKAIEEQNKQELGIDDGDNYKLKVALVGHPYNIYDSFINMNVVNKLNNLGAGVITEERVEEKYIQNQVDKLFKKPFWTFARNSYGFATHVAEKNLVSGIVYISSFACGIDSVVIELIKEKIGDFPFLILKIDEHTGEAGINTRIEAFCDMLERRCKSYEDNISAFR